MGGLSLAGLIGALVGLALGYVDYKVVGGVVEGKLRKLDRSSSAAEKEEFERKIRILRVVLFAVTMLAFPVIGYLFGSVVAGG
ncbi:hypothetical protein [uncultured Alsobacter sp.]|uniref:hypothetical protein n=1 Tax=uncultured Alsobacter sp. TaxID=1748258 RepID=UPI0025DFE988|nr:hypothetical protein [uncultured Alsobacter sp.]